MRLAVLMVIWLAAGAAEAQALPEADVDGVAAVEAYERGDRRAAIVGLRTRLRESPSRRLQLLHDALRLDVSPRDVLALPDAALDEIESEVAALGRTSRSATGLGIVGAVTGIIAIVWSIVGAVVSGSNPCTSSPFSVGGLSCTSNASVGVGFSAAGVALGVGALVTSSIAISLTVDAGHRRSLLLERLRAGAFARDEGAGGYLVVDGTM